MDSELLGFDVTCSQQVLWPLEHPPPMFVMCGHDALFLFLCRQITASAGLLTEFLIRNYKDQKRPLNIVVCALSDYYRIQST